MNIIEYGSSWYIEDELEEELFNDIRNFLDKNLESLHKNKEGYSTTGENAEQYWLKKGRESSYVYESEEYNLLEKRYRKEIHKRLKKAELLRYENFELTHGSSWSVVGGEGSYHGIHSHTSGVVEGISTCLYLRTPEPIPNDNSGAIYLVLHSDPSNFHVKPSCQGIQIIMPTERKFLIFPYHIPHGTHPQLEGVRQTYNVDYDFQSVQLAVKFNDCTNSDCDLNYC